MGWQALYMDPPGDPQPTGVYNPGKPIAVYKLLEWNTRVEYHLSL
jgi:hypothetical protein